MKKQKINIVKLFLLIIILFSFVKDRNFRYCKVKFNGKRNALKVIQIIGNDTIIDNMLYKKFNIFFCLNSLRKCSNAKGYSFIRIDKRVKKIYYRVTDEQYNMTKTIYPNFKKEQIIFDFSKVGSETNVITSWFEGKLIFKEKRIINNDTILSFQCKQNNIISHEIKLKDIDFNLLKGEVSSITFFGLNERLEFCKFNN